MSAAVSRRGSPAADARQVAIPANGTTAGAKTTRAAGGEGDIDRFFERLTGAIERALALAFIVAVCVNFANVVGRYAFDYAFLGADEAQIYIMVWMAFLGAAVVSWRERHLRMDVLVRCLPARVQVTLRAGELLLLAGLGGFVLVESASYAWRIFTLGQTSNTAGIPMWLPHSAVALGFALITLIALWRGAKAVRRGGFDPAPASRTDAAGGTP
jgi:TRAP-type C4-dicarboxylate transport system permease small subunit